MLIDAAMLVMRETVQFDANARGDMPGSDAEKEKHSSAVYQRNE